MLTTYIRNLNFSFTGSLLLLLTLPVTCLSEPPRVVVSIKPLHSLISHITDGISDTRLLLDQQQSPHHFQLRPSQRRLINQANIFFYGSNNLESFVEKIKASSDQLTFVELSRIPEIKPLAARSFHSHKNDHDAEKHEIESNNIDGHIWLSVENAQHISVSVTKTLSQRDPENAHRYQSNLQNLLIKLKTLQQNNIELFTKLRDRPFLVYHDAYQYFEVENKLSGAHFVTTSPEHTPGIKRIKELKQLIKHEGIQCIFYEPPNVPSLVKTLTENTAITLAALDPAGSQLSAGKQHYFTLIQQTASILYKCLSKH